MKALRISWSLWIALASGGVGLLLVAMMSRFNRPMLLSDIDRSTQREPRQLCVVSSSGDHCRSVELALTPAQQELGLMHRTQLPTDAGMLFVFPQDGMYPFWMKNTLIPLDMIWIDSSSRIVAILTAQPCTTPECPNYNPGAIARYVLEINAGQAQERELNVGDKIVVK